MPPLTSVLAVGSKGKVRMKLVEQNVDEVMY